MFAPSVLGVIAEVPLEPPNLRVALEGDDVGRDSVEEPPIVRNDDRAACVCLDGILERSQRVDVKVVGRFVEQKDVGALLENLGQVHTVAFAAGQVADHFFADRAP